MSYPLNNNTNTARQVNQQHTWMKPDLHLSRQTNISREQELQHKLKQTSLNPATSTTATKNVNSDDFPKLPSGEIGARRKKFATYKFYLDNLEPLVSKRIERGIKIMGATHEPFFSKKCTHLITAKTIPIHENLLAPTISSSSTATLNAKATKSLKKYDPIVESAIQFNTVLWSVDVMLKTVDFLMNASSSRKEAPVQEKRGLGNLLQEDKLFGPSTGTNSDAQSKRPHFVPFTGYFLIVEDATQAHRPPICKQWTKDMTKKPAENPWPYFKQTPKFRSPFGRKATPPPKKPADGAAAATTDAKNTMTTTAAANEGAKNETAKTTANSVDTTAKPKTTTDNNSTAKTNSQEDKENMPMPKQITSLHHAVIKPLTAPSTPSPLSSQKSQSQQQQQQTTQKQPDSQNFSLRASGFQPSCTNNIQSASTRSVSTSVSILQGENRRLPPGDSVNRLDKRMVENVTLNEHQKLCKQKAQKEEQARRERELKKKRDSRFCENCNVLFENLEEHSKQQTHQTFIRDQNNFKELDELLAKTHRRYKGPLPARMRDLIDPNIDGKNVEFVSDRKRPHPATPADDLLNSRKLQTADMMKKKSLPTTQPRIAANDTHHNVNHKWAEYGAVFD
ncbi:unnamed protein product [Mucor circinelloides]|uniref:DBF4-type domain-containing protein n=1 Tax=Mucor circinelloides f. circinelloides (strain 1006PhL) TaxID=1220926 RepID=S2IV86_MUCC1|nr:hypothetical protein HMPREF1544_11699 [Mucor circinelloides 1006PhL]